MKLHHRQSSTPLPNGVTATAIGPFPNILANTAGGTALANLTEIGGSGVSVVFTLAAGSNGNLAISGSQLVLVASPTLTPGATFQYGINVTDSGGSHTETSTSRSCTVPAGPTGITHTPDTILDNAILGTIASTLTPIGGTAPGTWSKTGLTKFDIATSGASSSLSLNSGGVGTITPGEADAGTQGTVTYTDAAGLSTSAITVNETVQDHTASSLIAKISLENTSVSSTSANANTIMFGHPYFQGDLAGLTYPVFKLNDGTVCPYSTGQRATWPTGGTQPVMQEVYRLQIPKAIAPGISDAISVYSNGTAPTASTLSLTNITANTDFKIIGTLIQSAGTDTGTWTATVNDAIANGSIGTTIEVYDNGQAGITYIIDGDFKQSGSAHGQLKARWYIQVLPTVSQTLSGFRVLGLVWQPLYNVDTPTKGMRIFSALTFQNGATVIRDMANTMPTSNNSGKNAFPFTWVSGTNFTVPSGTPLYGATNGYLCRLTTTGTLPGGLSTGTTYAIGHGTTDAQFKLTLSASGAVGGGGPYITGTSAGAGTHTMTIMPFVTQFYGIYTAGESATYDAFDATGTLITDTPLRFRMDTAYWVSTKTFLPYKIPVSSASNRTNANATTYIPNGAGGRAATAAVGTGNGMDQGVGATGDIPDLGPHPLQYTYHLFNQSAVDEAVVRTNGLCNSHWAFRVRSSANMRIVAGNNGSDQAGATYTGLDGPFPQFRWLSPAAFNFNGFSAPSTTNGYHTPTFLAHDTSHFPDWATYAYQFTGEPQFRDQMLDNCSNAIIQRSKGDPTIFGNWTPVGMLNNSNPSQANQYVNGSSFYGTLSPSPGGTRDDAWAINICAHGMLLADNLAEKPYIRDCLKSTAAFEAAWITQVNTYQPFAMSIGLLHFMMQTPQQPGFQWGYRYFAHSSAYTLTQDSNWLTVLNTITKYYEFAHTNGGAYNESQYGFVTRLGGADANDYAVPITGITKANPGVVSFASAPANFANGDMVMLAQVGGMTQVDGQIYRIANATSTSFALHDQDDNPVDTSAFGTYTTGGFAGAPFLPDINRWAGIQGITLTWTTTGPAFTAVRNSGDGANWVWTSPPVMTNGDWFVWANQPNDSPLPAGLKKFTQYFIINASGATFDVTTVDGDTGHIVRPTSAQATAKTAMLHRKTPPTNTVNFPSDAGTFQLAYGPVMAAKASGATVTQGHIDDLETMYQATVSAGRSSPFTNSKYLMNPSY